LRIGNYSLRIGVASQRHTAKKSKQRKNFCSKSFVSKFPELIRRFSDVDSLTFYFYNLFLTITKSLGLTHCLHYNKYVMQNLRAIEDTVELENKGKPAITSKVKGEK
jgi:hypothetical protein